MAVWKVCLIALGLAMDAFAVSVAEGVALHKVTRTHTLRIAAYFGLFQGTMPVIGWLAGQSLQGIIGVWDHWIAFGLLALIGGKMIADWAFGFETGEPREPSRGLRLISLSIATSLDALAVGVSLALLEVEIATAAILIGVITGILCAVGIQSGDRIGSRTGRWAELLGGGILCLIGAKILVQHLLAGGA
jgi:putative Mn2+ efflux pump MntP